MYLQSLVSESQAPLLQIPLAVIGSIRHVDETMLHDCSIEYEIRF